MYIMVTLFVKYAKKAENLTKHLHIFGFQIQTLNQPHIHEPNMILYKPYYEIQKHNPASNHTFRHPEKVRTPFLFFYPHLKKYSSSDIKASSPLNHHHKNSCNTSLYERSYKSPFHQSPFVQESTHIFKGDSSC